MPKNLSPAAAILLLMTLLLVTGCADSRDERFNQLAQQALHEQAEQNQRMADQSREIAAASRRLVEGDAAARKDLLAAQRQLTSELHFERANLNRQREELEQERQDIATERFRDPLIAQAIGAVGLTLACLLPLLLAGYIIRAVNRDGDDSAALSELLVLEITAEQPLLLPIARRPVAALEHSLPPDDDETEATVASNSD